VGQTGDDEFFDACDRYGIMVWQDFWLANPLDGPDPNDNSLFERNAADFVRRIRNHPSILLYCGRNEGNPPDELDKALRATISEMHPGLHYISNSAFGVVSGGGPYRAMPVQYYFKERATEKFHSEMGMPNIVSFESLQAMMPDSALWPQSRIWGVHDFCLEGAQGGTSFNDMIKKNFGVIDDVKEWLRYAQWINFEGYRAMFEAQSKNRMGLLLWMSHPAWPSMVWQTYDYYFEPTAAYFGCRKACEPLHIQWNPLTDSVETVNYMSAAGRGLTVSAELITTDGTIKWMKKISLDCTRDSVVRCFKVEYPDSLSSVYMLRLKLLDGTKLLSENTYWRGVEEGNMKAVRELPKVKLNGQTQIRQAGNSWFLTTRLSNPAKTPAMMVQLRVVREKSEDRILPVIYSDNYFSLMPGEQKQISIELKDEDTRGERPKVVTEGMNTVNE
jgi:hypothetical protein